MPFKKGQQKPQGSGRKPNGPNKATNVTRELINALAAGMLPRVQDAVATLEGKDLVQVWIKLCEFNVSKPQTVSVELTDTSQTTLEQTLLELSEKQ